VRARPQVLSGGRAATGLAVVALIAVYVLALGTRAGIAFDRRALLDAHTTKPWSEHWTVSDALHAVAAASFALMAIAVAALRRGDGRRLAAAALMVGGASVSAQLLKRGLPVPDLIGPASTHAVERSFPSGHAATTLALGLAVVDAMRGGWRAAAVGFAVVCSTAVGVGLLTLGWHYPSDVVGGFLIAGAWAAATRGPPARAARPGAAVVAVLLLAAIGCLALPWVAFAHLVDGRAAPPAFVGGASAIAFAAIAVTAGSSRR
jgi:membrane-associated phospholipid phosphatase